MRSVTSPSRNHKGRITLPVSRRGRRSTEQQAEYEAQMGAFAQALQEIGSRMNFKCGSRGWCYILEEHGLVKGDFDRAEALISDCRKKGFLPINFTAEDENRAPDNLERPDDEAPQEYADSIAEGILDQHESYNPGSFWDFQEVYVEVLVEKIDLRTLFRPVCAKYHVPIWNGRGWSDINSRAMMMERCARHEAEGRECVLLYCGDFDPVGLRISEFLLDNLRELEDAVGWSPEGLTIDRFGLNLDFIRRHRLSWTNNLQTSSGGDLADRRHKWHCMSWVQQYLHDYGARKVEANALVVRADAGRQLCRDAILKYIDLDKVEEYADWLEEQRDEVRDALPDAVRRALRQQEQDGE
jgi:hypothetical protein